MGRYWATRRAGNAVPLPSSVNPISNVQFLNLQDSEFIEVTWACSLPGGVDVAVRLYQDAVEVGDSPRPADCSDSDTIFPDQGVSGSDYIASVTYPGFAAVSVGPLTCP